MTTEQADGKRGIWVEIFFTSTSVLQVRTCTLLGGEL